MPLEESARVCLPDAVRIHIKDGRMERGNVKFLLPGEGNLSLWGRKIPLPLERKIPLPWPACAGTADRERLGEGSINGIS